MSKSDPVDLVLSRLKDVTPDGAGKWKALCPAHTDTKPSLNIAGGDNGGVLIHCFGGCTPEAVVEALGLRMRDLFPATKKKLLGRLIKAYSYRDAAGVLLYQCVRFEPKDFIQRRPDGRGGWVWNLDGVPRVLYRLPELLAADQKEPIYVVEGEKDAENLAELGFVATCNPGGAGKWRTLNDDSALHGRRVYIIPDRDKPGREHAHDVAARLHGKAAEVRLVELPGEAKDISDLLDGLREQGIDAMLGAVVDLEATAPLWQPPSDQAQKAPVGNQPQASPTIVIDTDEHRVVTEAVAALATDPDLYQRGRLLVRVLHDVQPKDGIRRPSGSPMIQTVPKPNIRERLTRYAQLVRLTAKGGAVPAPPTDWLVAAVDARGEWPGIRPLEGVSDAPILRADGTVCQQPGYDHQTHVLFEAIEEFRPIATNANRDDAVAALHELGEVVCDFRFLSEEHRAAWLAALLTPLARFAFEGPSPLFLVDANVVGAGKGLLCQSIARIVLGRDMPVSTYADEEDEMRKRITAMAIAGDRMVLLDNINSSFGNAALDRALTGTRWKDRILGRSEEIELPLLPTWYATGNNVAIAADTIRRVIHIRLDVLDERPHERTGFRHPNLLEWVSDKRGRLLPAGLTILSAYCRAGRPSQGLKPYGSFEGWSDLVRGAVVWVGMPDPYLTQVELARTSDTTHDALTQLLSAWREYDPHDTGIVVSELLSTLYPLDRSRIPSGEAAANMRAALESITNVPAGKPPTGRQVGNKFRSYRRRVLNGEFIDYDPNERERAGALWRLRKA